MKTSWSYDYILRKEGCPAAVRAWQQAKKQELWEATGVHWASWVGRGRLLFSPVMVTAGRGKPGAADQFAAHRAIQEIGRTIGQVRMTDFWKLSQHLGWELPRTLDAVYGLVRSQWASLDVCSTGAPVYVKVRIA